MTTVTIPDKYAKALSALGDVQTAVDLALQRYTIEQITAKIAHLRQRAQGYEAKYGMDYFTFAQRTAHDEAFVQEIEARGKESSPDFMPFHPNYDFNLPEHFPLSHSICLLQKAIEDAIRRNVRQRRVPWMS